MARRIMGYLSKSSLFEYSNNFMVATRHYLEFESPLQPLDEQIALLESRRESVPQGLSTEEIDQELDILRNKVKRTVEEIHAQLTPWQRVQIGRHPERPYALDYLESLCENFVELHGDRRFAEDPAIISGLATFRSRSIVFIGQQKGRNTKQKIYRNFGMPKPEGYRKALRMMDLAERFHLPILSLVDTPGAYPGMGAEERGQSQAIAENLERMSALRVPHVSIIIGEGGSGGALAIAMGDRVYMLQHAIYSVISPESCAAILWKDASFGPQAATELKIGAEDAKKLGIIDDVILEPFGGAHRDSVKAIEMLGDQADRAFKELTGKDSEVLISERYEKFRRIGTTT